MAYLQICLQKSDPLERECWPDSVSFYCQSLQALPEHCLILVRIAQMQLQHLPLKLRLRKMMKLPQLAGYLDLHIDLKPLEPLEFQP